MPRIPLEDKVPWLNEPDVWVTPERFAMLFNFSHLAKTVSRYCCSGALADFGFQTCCMIIPGLRGCPQTIRWYIKLRD